MANTDPGSDDEVLNIESEPAETFLSQIRQQLLDTPEQFVAWINSDTFITQCVLLAFCLTIGFLLGKFLSGLSHKHASEGQQSLAPLYQQLSLYAIPLSIVVALSIASRIQVSDQPNHVISLLLGLALVWLLIRTVRSVVPEGTIRSLLLWLVTPLAILAAFQLLDDFLAVLDGLTVQMGNIRISLLGIGRGVIFGGLLFWLGRRSNSFGQTAIRNNQSLDTSTKRATFQAF